MSQRELVPDPARTLQALRNLGYSFNSAVADLIDNSIAARAKTIHVDLRRRRESLSLTIRDDGRGMSPKRLREAMRLGARGQYEDGSLGKFGMGLKTASLSQCRKLIVISKKKQSKMFGMAWDLDHVERVRKWYPTRISEARLQEESAVAALRDAYGTIVQWKRMDRLETEYAALARLKKKDDWFGKLLHDLKLYLGMVFHRFLEGRGRSSPLIKIIFNDVELPPWDPFCRSEEATKRLKPCHFSIPGSAGKSIRIDPYILPVKESFSSPKAWAHAKGLLPWNESQGYYIYRENRLIHYGGWLRTRGNEEHSKYARVAISFTADLDDEFEVALTKGKLKLPASLAAFLKEEVNPRLIKEAQKPYRRPGPDPGQHRRSRRLLKKIGSKVLEEQKIVIREDPQGRTVIDNPQGTFTVGRKGRADSVKEGFGVEPGVVSDGRLWRPMPRKNGSIGVLLNQDHPFYRAVYCAHTTDPNFNFFVDAVFFALRARNAITCSLGGRGECRVSGR